MQATGVFSFYPWGRRMKDEGVSCFHVAMILFFCYVLKTPLTSILSPRGEEEKMGKILSPMGKEEKDRRQPPLTSILSPRGEGKRV